MQSFFRSSVTILWDILLPLECMCEAGVNIKAMQEILGHADAETTMDTYAEATKELIKSELINFEEFLKETVNIVKNN